MANKTGLDKMYGPLPMWGWALVLGAGWLVYKHMFVNKPNADSSGSGSYSLPQPNLSGLDVPSNSQDYAPAMSFPTSVSNPLPTPGSQSGLMDFGVTPAVAPAVNKTNNLLDPTTGRPVYSGPNGEGGFSWNPGSAIPMGQMVYQMPDGRWSSYYPGQYIQNGNRIALGLGAVGDATSTAPGSNPTTVASLYSAA